MTQYEVDAPKIIIQMFNGNPLQKFLDPPLKLFSHVVGRLNPIIVDLTMHIDNNKYFTGYS